MASKLKAVDPKSAEPNRSKILIFGKPGVGKTWTSLDFPSVYYIDTEGGASLSHYTDKLKKSGGMYFGPDQGSQDYVEVIEQVKALGTEQHQFKTVIIDSITKIFNNEIAKEMDRLGDKDVFGASKKPAVSLTRQLVRWIDRIDMNVILIAHEKPKWAEGAQEGYTFDAWEKLEYELDLCLNIQKRGTSRKAVIVKTRLEKFEDQTSFDWSYDAFAKLYGRDVLESDSKAIQLADATQVTELKYLVELLKIDVDTLQKWLDKAKADSIEEMSSTHIQACIDMLRKKMTAKNEKGVA